MKANRHFLNERNDEAVSPVIAVILMVAITVVLAATVYVWVSGFGASGSQAKSASLSLASSSGGVATLTLSSVSSGTNWNNLKIVIDGLAAGAEYGILVSGTGFTSFERNAAWDGSSRLSSTSRAAGAGDTIKVGTDTAPSGTVTVKLVDLAANTVIASVNGGTLTAQAAVADGISACSGGADTATLTQAFYSKTATDSAAIHFSNLQNGAVDLTAATHTVASTSLTGLAPIANTETLNFAATEIFDIGGNAAAGTQVCGA